MKHRNRIIILVAFGILCITVTFCLFSSRTSIKAFYDDIRWEKARKELLKDSELFMRDYTPFDTIAIAGHFFVPCRAHFQSDSFVVYYLYIPKKDSVSFDIVHDELVQSGYSPKTRFQKHSAGSGILKSIKKKTFIEIFMWEDDIIYEVSSQE